ncbi:MAG: type III-A CRISPR-associated RAMP protein Csm4, partial [Anaerolineales bacterium]
GLGQEETRSFWSSDSLFSSLIDRLALLYGKEKVDEWIQPFIKDVPPFLLTSLFPFAGGILFFPLPLAASLPSKIIQAKNLHPKALRKVQFVSEKLYRQLLLRKSLAELETSSIKIQEGKIWLTEAESVKLPTTTQLDTSFNIWEIEKRPRVTVERASNIGSLFHIGAVYFAPKCGLWFGVQWFDKSYKTLFANLLTDLGDAGLGGERSVGYGKGVFNYDGDLELPEPKTMWTSLSRYLPKESEMTAFQHSHAAWKIQTVGGWLDSPQKHGQRRRMINLIQEGATLGVPDHIHPPYGKLIDLRPRYKTGEESPIKHAAYRSGLTVAVGYGGDS